MTVWRASSARRHSTTSASSTASCSGGGARFPLFKTRLGSLPTPEAKKDAGRALNEATQRVSHALGARRSELVRSERLRRLDAERLDLTESTAKPRAGTRIW
jgi:phenylalanyl-tRNA synthetase alpha subunit